jgi:queuosine precursor transporter
MENSPSLNTKREWTFIALAGLFITNAITAELISSKLIEIPIHIGSWNHTFITIIGVLPWPVVFLLTDTLNEFYGEKAVRRLSWLTAALIGFCFVIVNLALMIPAHPRIGVTDKEFHSVFGQAPWIMIGSIAAFLLSQLFDVTLFHWVKSKTGNKLIWLRSTGSTVISQLLDTLVVLYIGFVLPGKMNWQTFLDVAPVNYLLKLSVAVLLTPAIYGLHAFFRWHFRGSSLS